MVKIGTLFCPPIMPQWYCKVGSSIHWVTIECFRVTFKEVHTIRLLALVCRLNGDLVYYMTCMQNTPEADNW